MQCSWSPASRKKTLDLFCSSIQGGKSIEIVSRSNCTSHWTPPCVSLVRHVCVRGSQRQVSDVTGVNVHRPGPSAPAEQTRGRGGEWSDTKPERDHIVVCQTSAFLSNPHTQSLIILPCCSSSPCLSLSLTLTHSLYPSLSFFHLSVMLSLSLNWPHFLHFSLSQYWLDSVQSKSSTYKITIYSYSIYGSR